MTFLSLHICVYIFNLEYYFFKNDEIKGKMTTNGLIAISVNSPLKIKFARLIKFPEANIRIVCNNGILNHQYGNKH